MLGVAALATTRAGPPEGLVPAVHSSGPVEGPVSGDHQLVGPPEPSGGDGLLTMLTAAMDGPHGALVQGG